ncbi:hypothetical protein DR950_34810 [Kitasatospora xanthocidica]|uniref:Uncharacterized protein n=1 Tax=Kitasatospora xanthocidica TaxID=83382 RepID=A0A373A472_9ACTN|nr:hypothetical protein [Kitasatospora xanthocidica]RGD62235.1 hypothetical protein DR950_34810 [Kitasatospora xanthocidica]
MTIVAVFRPTRPSTDRGRLRSTLAAVGRRLAASPLDNSVLRAAPAPAAGPAGGGGGPAAAGTGGLRARWRTVPAPDGTARLEATWHPGR